MVYEDRVEQIPVKVCRMEAVAETVRVPRVVEKRVPVTYSCCVPRVVCTRVPLDPCGTAIVVAPTVTTSSECCTPAPVTSVAPQSSPGPDAGYDSSQPRTQLQPTPAQPRQEQNNGANVQPSLPPESNRPEPVNPEQPVPPTPGQNGGSSVYPNPNTGNPST